MYDLYILILVYALEIVLFKRKGVTQFVYALFFQSTQGVNTFGYIAVT